MRVIAVKADHIDPAQPVLGHQTVNWRLIGIDDVFMAGAGAYLRRGFPAVEANPLLGKRRSNVFEVGQHLVGDVGTGKVINGQATHLATP
ncbi:hypothetical protein D3C76_1463270 [compost metagenome]